jgi:signal transduction histidine kinase
LSARALLAQSFASTALQQLGVMAALSLGIAALLTAMTGRAFVQHLIYSVCVGAVCFVVVALCRWSQALLVDLMHGSALGLTTTSVVGWKGAVLGTLLALVLGPLLGLSLGDLLTGSRVGTVMRWDSGVLRITLVLSVLGSAVAFTVLSNLERLSTARVQAEAAQRLAAQTQLRLLQSQLEPHMLFNTLANLRVLITLEPARAQAMLDHLIAYLRANLSASRTSTHSLSAEFDRVADYLALMQVRMGPRLRVQLDLPAALRDCAVPVLLLQPLVENAIKHGLEPHTAGGLVQVLAVQQGHQVRLLVRDTGLGLPSPGAAPEAPVGTGFGLIQVRERLTALYGAQGQLRVEPANDDQGGTLVTVEWPLTHFDSSAKEAPERPSAPTQPAATSP